MIYSQPQSVHLTSFFSRNCYDWFDISYRKPALCASQSPHQCAMWAKQPLRFKCAHSIWYSELFISASIGNSSPTSGSRCRLCHRNTLETHCWCLVAVPLANVTTIKCTFHRVSRVVNTVLYANYAIPLNGKINTRISIVWEPLNQRQRAPPWRVFELGKICGICC